MGGENGAGALPLQGDAAVQRWQGVIEILSEEGAVLGYAHAELWSEVGRRRAGAGCVREYRHWEGTIRPLRTAVYLAWPSRTRTSVRLRLVGSGREGVARLDGDFVVDAGGNAVLVWAKVTGVGDPPF